MSYLRVPNWEKHQHRDLAGKGNMPWFKFDSGIFDDPAIADLNAYEFRAYIRALTLAARTGNRLPANAGWLRAEFGRSWYPVCSRLVAGSLLTGTLPPQKHPQTPATHRADDAETPRIEEKRGEETRKNRSLEALQDAREDEQVEGLKASGAWAEPGGALEKIASRAAAESMPVLAELDEWRARRGAGVFGDVVAEAEADVK